MGKKKGRGLTYFFARVGEGVIRTGEATSQLSKAVKKIQPKEKSDEITRRLRELKELEMLRREELREGLRLREEKRMRGKIEALRREELKRPLSERLSETLYVPFRRPAEKLMRLFKGIDEDLYRANIPLPPDRYVAVVTGASVMVGATSILIGMLLFPPILALAIGFGGSVFALLLGRSYPSRRVKARSIETNKEIPYVLRHMATHLSSGIGLPESMTSISKADYGVLSEEFGRVIRDMRSGMSMDEALAALSKRMDSEPLRRFVRQVQRTLRTGGDLADILNSLAEETSFEMRMKLRDYTQSLNMLTMMYMFASSVVPALLIIMTAVSSGMGGATLTTGTGAVLLLLMVPLLLVIFLITVKRFEPRV